MVSFSSSAFLLRATSPSNPYALLISEIIPVITKQHLFIMSRQYVVMHDQTANNSAFLSALCCSACLPRGSFSCTVTRKNSPCADSSCGTSGSMRSMMRRPRSPPAHAAAGDEDELQVLTYAYCFGAHSTSCRAALRCTLHSNEE
jgi:hypothetical protein